MIVTLIEKHPLVFCLIFSPILTLYFSLFSSRLYSAWIAIPEQRNRLKLLIKNLVSFHRNMQSLNRGVFDNICNCITVIFIFVQPTFQKIAKFLLAELPFLRFSAKISETIRFVWLRSVENSKGYPVTVRMFLLLKKIRQILQTLYGVVKT